MSRRSSNRIVRRVALAVAPILVAIGIVALPAASASAVNYVPCGDVTAVGGLVGAVDGANGYGGGTLTINLTPGCTYTIPEPAWDYDDHGNKIYTDSGFWQINNTRGYDNKLIVEGNGATITRGGAAGMIRLFDIGHLGDVELRNLTITGFITHHGRNDGYQDSANPGGAGGAIANEGNLVLDGVTITGNGTGNGENGDNGGSGSGDPAASGGRGGGIYNSGTLTINNSTISANYTGVGGNGGDGLTNGGQGGSGGDGGGIYNTGSLTVNTSTITGNYTGWAGGAGSGIYGGPPGYRGSGGAIASSGSVTISRSLIQNNLADGMVQAQGGAIDMQGGNLTVTNSTFVGNKAWRGGAIHTSGGSASIRSSTFTGNDATGTGDFITGDVAAMDSGAAMTFANTLLIGNDPTQTDCNTQVTGAAVSYSSLGGLLSDENNGCGTNTVIADAKLEALGAWGGPTQSRLPRSDSPVLGAGAAAYCLPTDQRGSPRPASGCDVGAVERVATPAGAIAGLAIAPINTATAYTTTASAGGAALAYRWSVTGVTSSISSTTVANPQITFTSSGIASVRLNVRIVGTSDSESIDLTALSVKVPPADNVPPTITWSGTAATAANEGDTKRFTYTVVEPNGNTWSVSSGFPSCGTGGLLVAAQTQSGGGYFDCEFANGPTSPLVKVQVEDSWSSLASVSSTVTVAEVAPTIAVTGGSTVAEGGVTSFSYTIHEVGSDTFTPATSCTGAGSSKVGSSDTYAGSGHNTSGTFQCRVGNGPSTAGATVTANGGSGSASISVTNVAPTISVSGPTPVAENGNTSTSYRYELNAVDPGDKANLTVVPGSPSCGGPGVGVVVGFDATAVVCRFSDGPRTAIVTSQVKDQDGATSTGGGLTVTVNNVAPVVVVSQPTVPINEGGIAYFSVTATDGGTEELTITPPAGCTANFVHSGQGFVNATLACTYEDGPATVSRTVTVGDGVTTGTAVIANQQVLDVLPSIGAGWIGWDTWQNQASTLNIGGISDPGTDTPTQIVVNWGDDSSDTFLWPLTSSALTHSYAESGAYFPTIDIINEDGTHLDRGPEARMVVHNSAPVTSLSAPATAQEGVPTGITYTVAQGAEETFSVQFLSCGRDRSNNSIEPTDVVQTAHGGSFTCTWPIGNVTYVIDLRIIDEGGPSYVSANVVVPNSPVVFEWTSGPDVAYEDGAVHRFDFHASDNGSLGMTLMTYSLYGGLALMYGCGDGGTVVSQVPYYYGGTVAGVPFDTATGDGYIECIFTKGPTIANVRVTIGDWMSETVADRPISILNAAPTVTVTPPEEPVAEGSPAVFTFTTSDPSNEAVSVDSVDCGPNGTAGEQTSNSFACTFDDGPADYVGSVTVTDGVDTATGSAPVHVDNVAPTSTELSGGDFYETGEPYELTIGETTDVGDDTASSWSVHWGDGSTSILNSRTPNPTHVYIDDAPYTITVDVTDEDGAYLAIGSKNLLVADHTPPVLTVPEDTTMEGNGTDGVYWGWPRSAIDERDGDLEVQCTGYGFYGINFFDIGVSTRDCWATDAAGNRSEASFTLTAVDTTAPVFPAINFGNLNATNADGLWIGWNDVATDAVDYRVQGVCDTADDRVFPIGSYTVHCTAEDRAHNVGEIEFSFTVGDFAGPSITGMSNLNVSATSPSGGVGEFVTPTATDAIDGVVAVTCDPASGTTFPLGQTTVTCSATDAAANTSTTTFVVSVTDVTAPVFTQPADLLVAPTGPDGAVVGYSLPTVVDAVDSELTVSCLPASGELFPIGSTTVECSTADDAGNPATTSFSVNVQDEQSPVVTTVANISIEATGPDGETVTFDDATATDVVDGDLEASCVPASGSVFDIGTTVVTCSATDSESNTGTDTFTVSIVDTTEPTVVAPADVELEATAHLTPVNYTAATATDLVDGALAPTCLPASGSSFGVGTTTVTCSVTDEHENTGTASFEVVVTDTTDPVITASDITVAALSAAGARVDYAPEASDLVDGELIATCDPASGSLFAPESTTTVTCTATDTAGNETRESFDVIVHGAVFTLDTDARETEVEVSVDLFEVGDYVIIDEGGPDEEVRYISDLGSIIFAAPLAHAHAAGTSVSIIDPPPLGDTEAPTITFPALGTVQQDAATPALVECADDGVGVEECEIPEVDTSTIGTHTVTARSWDFNGNVSSQSVTYTVIAPVALGATGIDTVDLTTKLALLLLVLGALALALNAGRDTVSPTGLRRGARDWLRRS